MDLTNFAISFFILAFSVLSIATSAIAIECYTTSDLKNQKPSNWIFIIVNLAMASIITLLSLRSLYMSYKTLMS
jgi:hypothetical protein